MLINVGDIFKLSSRDAVTIIYWAYHLELPPDFTLGSTAVNTYRGIKGLPPIDTNRTFTILKDITLPMDVSTKDRWRDALAIVFYAKKQALLDSVADEGELEKLAQECNTVQEMWEVMRAN
jgi:hypothetical protein